MSVDLNILCLVCIFTTPEIMLNLTKMHRLCPVLKSNEISSNDHVQTELVQTKFSMATLYLDNHHQFFWPLFDRLVKCAHT